MTVHKAVTIFLGFLFFGCLTSCKTPVKNYEAIAKEQSIIAIGYLLSFNGSLTDGGGYKNEKGEVVISPGKYAGCFTDTFREYAIVIRRDSGFVAIDRQENVLYKVYPYDNGPDYPVEGLFRMIRNNKIGFADSATGKIVINPEFDCAYPFENGAAKVSVECKIQSMGEHTSWLSDHWYYIDKTGKKVEQPKAAGDDEN